MIAKVPAIRKYGLWALIGVFVLFAINLTRDQVVWNVLTWVWGYVQEASVWIINFAVSHGGLTAVVLLCVWIGILVSHAYINTLPPNGILFHATEPRHDGNGSWSGFTVENRSGEDLLRVWITDKKTKLKLQWGRHDPSNEYQEISNGKEELIEWLYYEYETKLVKIRNKSLPLPTGKSEIELEFGATPRGQSPYIKPLYVTVEITDLGVEIISTDW